MAVQAQFLPLWLALLNVRTDSLELADCDVVAAENPSAT